MEDNQITKIDVATLSTQVSKKYSVDQNTFLMTAKEDQKDLINIEIGDSKQPDFKPQFKIMRWDNEVNFSMRAQEHPNAIVETEDDKIKYITPDYEVHQYDKPEASENGGFEFEWILPRAPESNILTATIQTKGLDFFKQFEEDGVEKEPGYRKMADNIIGSYAVYHSTKGGLNAVDGNDYKVGKAFHIYRPKAIDSNDKETWCEINVDIENGILTVEIPKSYLNTAIYPVTVDPTFGYTSIGASVLSGIEYAIKYSTTEVGTVTSISAYLDTSTNGGGSFATGFAMYSDSAGAPGSLLTSDAGGTSTVSGTGAWYTNNINPNSSVTASTAYHLAIWDSSNGGVSYYFDTGSANQRSVYDGNTFPITFENWSSTFHTPLSRQARMVSIYATYTVSGGGGPPEEYTLLFN